MTVIKYRLLVILTFLILLFSYLLEFYYNKELVNFVADFAESLQDVGKIRNGFYTATFFILFIIAVYSFIGLLILKNSARFTFLAAFFLMIPLYLLIGVSVQSGFSRIFYDVGMLLSGVLLTLIFTQPVKKYFGA